VVIEKKKIKKVILKDAPTTKLKLSVAIIFLHFFAVVSKGDLEIGHVPLLFPYK